MRQKNPPKAFRSTAAPEPERPRQVSTRAFREPEPKAPAEASPKGRRNADGGPRSTLLLAGGLVLALVLILAVSAFLPVESRVSQGDVSQMIANAMASATPAPSYASRVFNQVAPSIVQIRASRPDVDGKLEKDSGSGVIIDDAGSILTSLHVVKDSRNIQVIFFDDTETRAWIFKKDPLNDIAVLRTETAPSQLIPATLGNPAALHVGDEAIVVGNPFGIRHTLTDGVISGLGRNIKSPKTGVSMTNLIQLDAAVNPGNSGGPLLNRDGEVVGIVTSLLNPTDQEVFIGIGFAVPIDTAASAAGSPPD